MIALSSHTNWVTSVNFVQNTTKILSGSCDKTIKIWDYQTGNNILTLIGHLKPVTSVCYSFNNKMIISGSSDNTIKIWDS